MDGNKLWNYFRMQDVPFSACAVWLPWKIPMVYSSSNTLFLTFIPFYLFLVFFLYLLFLSDLFDFFVLLAFLSTLILSFFSPGVPLINIAQICRYKRQTTRKDHVSNFFSWCPLSLRAHANDHTSHTGCPKS